MKHPPRRISMLASLALLAAAAIAADGVPAPQCAKCADIPRMQRELNEQKAARDAFKEFTYEATGQRRVVSSADELKAAHAALFSELMNGGRKGKGRGRRTVARPALETDLNDCKILEVLKNGKRVPLDEEAYRKKLCLFADFLIEHEKDHVKRCERAHKAGLSSELHNPLNLAELELRGYDAGIALLEAQLASLKAGCVVAGSGPPPPPPGGGAYASRPDVPALQRDTQRIAQALQKGWS